MSAGRIPGLLLPLALAAALPGGCGPSWRDVSRSLADPAPAEERAPIHDRQRTFFDREATRPRTEVTLLLHADGRSSKDGVERRWYPDGTLELERGWREDEPRGWWRSWWPDGTPRFEHRFDPGEATPMRWWFESGVVSSEGPARGGVREGPWRARHPGGVPAYAGGYVAGRRDGLWTFWHPDGSLAERGRYVAGERVGPWELHAPGDVPDSAPRWEADPPGGDQ